MKNRGFQFNTAGICAACVLTGVLASMMTGWMFFGGRTTEQAAVPATIEIPIARAAGGCDRADTYITTTGMVEMGIEAVYVLDSMTGQLFAGVISKNMSNSAFQAKYQGNVKKDLEAVITKYNALLSAAASSGSKRGGSAVSSIAATQKAIQMPQEPKFIMTTGIHDQTGRQGAVMPSVSALYVTEVNTGLMLVYMLPWNKTSHAGNRPFASPVQLMFFDRVVTPMVSEEEL